LQEGSRAATRRRRAWSGKAIVGFQVALSTLLVMAAAFFVRTIYNLNHIKPGFQPQNLTLFYVHPPAGTYPGPQSTALDQRLEAAFAAIPGVQSVTAARIPLLAGSQWNSYFFVEGGPQVPSKAEHDQSQVSDVDAVGQNFFEVMQIPILAGRSFTAQDTHTSPVVSVVNEALAHKFFPNQNPIGKRFRMGTEGEGSQWIEIVGVCANSHYHDLKEELPPIHFDLYRQTPEAAGLTFIVRSPLSAAALTPALRNAAKRIDPGLPLTNIRSQQSQIESSMLMERLFASLTAGFGVLALALACVGIYGIMAYTVSQRTKEVGIRLALGAARHRIRAMVLKETAWLAAVGVLLGVATTFALIHLIQSMLYGLEPYDPLTLGGGAALLLFVALIAGWIPAHRASQVEPIDALRSE
jgi:predicted permease